MTAPDDTRPHVSEPAPALETASSAPEAATPAGGNAVRERVIDTLTTIYDPEIPVNIYELGLVYELDVNADGDVAILMTLTSPSCPVAESLPPEVEAKVGAVEGVRSVKVDLTWDPPWTPERMSEAAKLELGFL
ncbi:MAG TPA: SUF system Fe-S cluster assembly protein [Alphaproteobacteria bacterium]|nr:SUF system Fe-S cluster assembly protein [Alphaproteobacteria bacterium]